jgi:hypothetical protein
LVEQREAGEGRAHPLGVIAPLEGLDGARPLIRPLRQRQLARLLLEQAGAPALLPIEDEVAGHAVKPGTQRPTVGEGGVRATEAQEALLRERLGLVLVADETMKIQVERPGAFSSKEASRKACRSCPGSRCICA